MGRRKQAATVTQGGLPSAQDARAAQQRLRSLGCSQQAAILARFFKTGPGQYGEGDQFIGVKVPVIRNVAREFKSLLLAEVECLLHSEIHEERLLALVILVGQFERGDDAIRKRIYDFYLANTQHINNWDLMDLSAPQIVGGYLETRSRKPLDRVHQCCCFSLWIEVPVMLSPNMPRQLVHWWVEPKLACDRGSDTARHVLGLWWHGCDLTSACGNKAVLLLVDAVSEKQKSNFRNRR